jgi:ATP phosphoribosyltransferase
MRIALPSKGKLAEKSREWLREKGVQVSGGAGKRYFEECNGWKIFFARARDIPKLVEGGFVDCGVTGLDLVRESGARVSIVEKLSFGKCRLVLGGKEGKKLSGLVRIATAFPAITREFAEEIGLVAEVIELDGAVESSVSLGIADAVLDVVETGRTFRENGLVELREAMKSSAVLVAREGSELGALG